MLFKKIGKNTAILLSFLLASTQLIAAPTIEPDFLLQSKERISRTAFNYTYKAQLKTDDLAVQNATATLISTSDNTKVLDNTVNFGTVLANSIEDSLDIFTIQQNRSVAYDPDVLTWNVQYPEPGIEIGEVTGNTASYNSIATFGVELSSQPFADVIIPLSSSDESEGVVQQEELIFTPENWNIEQEVIVKGRNSNVIDGIQNYTVTLSPAQSSDSAYSGFDADDVEMKGIILLLSEPTDSISLVSGLESTISPITNYTGSESLSYSLVESPAGMTIDINFGIISWTPTETASNDSHIVTVKVTDGILFSEASFDVVVQAPQSLQIQAMNNTVTVTEENSTLNGLTIELADENLNAANISLSSVPSGSVDEVPSQIVRVTDFFIIDDPVSDKLKVRLPLSAIPAGTELQQIDLYSLVEADGFVDKFWSPVGIDIDIYEEEGNSIVEIILEGLEGIFFIGIEPVNDITNNIPYSFSPIDVLANSFSLATTQLSDIACTPKVKNDNSLDHNEQDCTVSSNSNIKIKVLGFGNSASSTRWNNTSIEELITWLVDAQEGFKDLGLSYNDEFTVRVHSMPKPSYLGYVTSGSNENRNTLHLTSANIAKNTMYGTSVHEYFHHAQARSGIVDKDLLIDSGRAASWFIEGSARWFEDYLLDSLNTYVGKEGATGSRILETGLNKDATKYFTTESNYSGKDSERPYQRFTFIKFLESKCGAGFTSQFNKFLNINKNSDFSGINNLSEELKNSGCNFGNHLGIDKKSNLEAALLYYQYATLYKDNISLLDSNEINVGFNFKKTDYEFSRPWLDSIAEWINLDDNIEYELAAKDSIPPAGSFSFYTKEVIGNLPEGKIAVLNIESDKDIIVSIVSPVESFESGDGVIGTNKHKWFNYSENSNFIYEFNGKVPKLFVSLVNPSTTETAPNIKVTFDITDEVNHDLIITSHSDDDSVNNRVVEIQGKVPDEIRDSTNSIRVTNRGATTVGEINADGTFSIGVVVTLGENLIKLQGFNGTQAVTTPTLLKINGVEGTSSGRNALLASRVAFVLRWNTSTDIDLYSTDKDNGTIWYSNDSVPPGSLDYDNTSGYGPEVITYSKTDDAIYSNGKFDIDVHYYSGSPPTAYSLDVIMNETDPTNVKLRHYESKQSLPSGNSSQNGPTGSGDARFNDVLSVVCNSNRICSIGSVDDTKLSTTTTVIQSDLPVTSQDADASQNASSYEKCMSEFNKAMEKSGNSDWYCHSETGAKVWH